MSEKRAKREGFVFGHPQKKSLCFRPGRRFIKLLLHHVVIDKFVTKDRRRVIQLLQAKRCVIMFDVKNLFRVIEYCKLITAVQIKSYNACLI